MINFTPIRTRRLSVQLRELTAAEIITLLSIPASRPEYQTTEFLKKAADQAKSPARGFVTDPRLMTVQERLRLCAHYIGHTGEDGGNFKIGDARVSDYTIISEEWDGSPLDLTEAAGYQLAMLPLLGWQAEGLERICQNSGEWHAGAMACQMLKGDETLPDPSTMSDLQIFDWINKRLLDTLALPESEFLQLLDLWSLGDAKLTHYYRISFQDDGIIVMPTDEAIERSGAAGVAPARFPFDSCISGITKSLFQRPAEPVR